MSAHGSVTRAGVECGLDKRCGTVAGRSANGLDAPAAAMLAADEETAGATAEEVAARIGRPAALVEGLLADECRRGHLERRGDRYVPTAALIARLGPAFTLVWTEGE